MKAKATSLGMRPIILRLASYVFPLASCVMIGANARYSEKS